MLYIEENGIPIIIDNNWRLFGVDMKVGTLSNHLKCFVIYFTRYLFDYCSIWLSPSLDKKLKTVYSVALVLDVI